MGQDLVELQHLRQGLAPLVWDQALAETCLNRALVLAAAGELTHEDSGRSVGLQLVAQGFPPGLYGEVLGAGADPDSVWRAWLASPTHAAVLRDPRWTAWGWAKAESASGWLWVVRFRAP